MNELQHRSNERTRGAANEAEPRTGLSFTIPDNARILIVSENDSVTEQLTAIFRNTGFIPETTRSISAACERVRSDRFQVIFSTPTLGDGSWKRLINFANRYGLGFEVVLLARNFDLADWVETLTDGAFDVVDVVHELSRTPAIAKRAFWTAYLKGAGPRPKTASPQKAA